MKFSRDDLVDQTQRDQAHFEAMRINVKNALIREVKKVWPRANEIWPQKYQYEGDTISADSPSPSPD